MRLGSKHQARGAIQENVGMLIFKHECLHGIFLLRVYQLTVDVHSTLQDHKPSSSYFCMLRELASSFFHPASCFSNRLHTSHFISAERKLQRHLNAYIKCYIISFSFVKYNICF